MSSNPAIRDGDNPRTPRRKKSNDIDVLKRDARVLDVYKHYLDLKKDGPRRYKGLCPWHNDHDPSFNVYRDKDEPDVWLYNCFTCFGEDSGNIVQFVAKMEDIALPEGYPEACTEVRRMLDDDDLNTEAEQRIFDQQAPPEKEKKTYEVSTFLKQAAALEFSHPACDWLANERGISFETAQRLHVGFRQNVKDIVGKDQLKKIEDIVDKGWVSFPYLDEGKIVAIKYRSIVRKAHIQEPGMKGGTLFNLPSTIDSKEDVFLTEGELDAVVMEQAGFRAVALPMAKFTVTEELKDKLLEARTVYLAGDNDGKVGNAAMNKLHAEMRGSKRVFKLIWPAGMKDANQTFIEHCGRDIEQFKILVQQLMEQARVPEWRKLFHNGREANTLPTKKFLINNFLPEGTTVIGALPYHGKTFLALSISKALVTGKPFLGQQRFTVPEPVPVLYLIPETGSAGFNERRKLLKIPEDDRFLFRTLSHGETLKLDDPLLLEAAAGRVVVLDTAVRFSDGGDENSASDTHKNIASNIYRLIGVGARGVIALHHSVKQVTSSGRNRAAFNLQTALRGSGDFAGMPDAVYGILPIQEGFAEADPNPDFLMKVKCLKARDFDPPTKLQLQGRPYLDEIGDFGVILQESREDQEIAVFTAAVEADPTINYDELTRVTGISKNRISEVVAPAAGYKKPKTRNGKWAKSATSQSKDTIQ